MKNPDADGFRDIANFWIDAEGNTHRTGSGHKAELLTYDDLPAVTMVAKGGEFGESYGTIGQIIPTEWWLSHYAQEHASKGVMVTREAMAAALRASAWPDSDAPCGSAGNSKDDDATCDGKDAEGNCIVRLFMRGSGYFKVKIPRNLFLEVVDE